MKRGKFDSLMSPSRLRLLRILISLVFFYMIFMSFEIPLVLRTGFGSGSTDGIYGFISDGLPRPLESEEDLVDKDAPTRPTEDPFRTFGGSPYRTPERRTREVKKVSGLVFNESVFDGNISKEGFSELHKAVKHAWLVGRKLWHELESGKI